jgi:hypothetical protein
MSTRELDEILSKEQYERRRTPQQLNEWVEAAHSRLRERERDACHRLLDKGIGKNFITEMHPLNLFVQSYYPGRDDISFVAKLGGQSFDAQVFQGEAELHRIEITEAIDGRKWALQKELLLQNGWAPDTGPIECQTRKHNRKKGDIKVTQEYVQHAQFVEEKLRPIEKALDNKFRKSKGAVYGPGTWLLVAFDDTNVLCPDQLSQDDKNKVRDVVRKKIHALNPRFDKVFLVGWSGRSLYEFDGDDR